MATHTPYDPPSRYLEEAISAKEKRTFDRRTGLFPLLNQHYSEGIPDEDLERLRRLYFGAAKYVGEQLQDIISMLTANDLRDETIVVITADHGEHLGEVDELGAMRFYHLQSVSEHLLQVPLIILHPDGLNETISEYVSLTDVGSYLLDSPKETNPAVMTSDTVLSEMPAQPQYREKFEAHDPIPDSIAKRIAEEHLVVGYMQDWKVAISSTDEKWAWRDGQEQTVGSAPEVLVGDVTEAVQSLSQGKNTEHNEMSEDVKSQLEQLGYY